MKTSKTSQRLLSLLLAWTLILTCAPVALAEDSATAASMRLMKTEGTVSITNSKGRSVQVRDDLLLRSGYGVDTEEASYAWINLDDAKLLKEDAVSEVSVRKSGKKLEILLESGNLFFNVKKPLDKDETFNIRTSTIGVGIRGTCGWVKVIDQWTTYVYILEGSVQATVTDPVTGEVKSETISGGESAVCTVYPQDHPGDKCEIIRNTFTANDIDGFVLTETVGDNDLCDKIYDNSGIDLRDYPGNPEDKLREDQETVHEKLTAIQTQITQQDSNISSTPVWTNPSADSETGTPSHLSPSVGRPSSSQTVTLTMPQEDDTVNDHLSKSGVSGVILQPGTARASTANLLEVDSGITVPAGKSLTLQDGVGMTVLGGQAVQVAGNLAVGGTYTGTIAPVSGAVIRAKNFDLAAEVDGWKVSDTADSSGYYTLAPERKTYTVNFNANGGSVSPASMTTGTDGRLTSLPTAARNGYTFDGWFTASTGGTQITTAYVFTANATVYAHWTQNAAEEISGEAGANVRWSYNRNTRTLTFSGTGPMTDYSANPNTSAPWAAYATEMRSLVIENGVASIGSAAFTGCTGLTSLTIPNSVTVISNYAFERCTGLNSVTLPNSISELSVNIFAGCTNLTSVTIPDGVKSIEWGAFNGCTGLTSLTIPNSVTEISQVAFTGCSNLNSITIPNSVRFIGIAAFSSCNSLKDVYYSGTQAQWNAISIKSGNEPLLNATLHCQGVTTYTITFDANLGTVTPTSMTTGADGRLTSMPTPTRPGYTFVGWYTVYNTQQVTTDTVFTQNTDLYAWWTEDVTAYTITFNANGGTVTPTSATTGTDGKLASLPTPTRSGYTFNGWYTARTGGTEVTSSYVFTKNTTVYAQWTQETGKVTWRVDGTTLYIEGSGPMESMEGYNSNSTLWPWFSDRSTITSIVVENGVTTIGNYAFDSCSSLTSVTIGNSVTNIGDRAFYGCKDLTSITIPGNVASIGADAFLGCSSLTSITIPDSVTSIGKSAFYNCSSLTSVTIPSSVTTIGNSAFSWCSSLTSVTIPNSVTSIGGEAFSRCTGLTSVTIGNSVTTIGNSAFSSCSSLTSVTIPDSVTYIGDGAFDSCSGLTSVTIPSSVTYIGGHAFSYCTDLTSITIPDSVTSIGAYAFHYCTSLNSITIPDSITSIWNYMFYQCYSLASVTIPVTVTSIGYASFSGCNSLKDVYYAGTEAQWDAIAINTAGNIPINKATKHYNSAGRSIVSYSAPGYTDIPAGAWYAEAASYCRDNNLMNGTSETEFSPDATLTRAMMVTVLHRLAGKPAAASTANFADVPAGKWYSDAIAWANGAGIVLGYPDGSFGTNDPVTHGQVALIFQRYSGNPDVETVGADTPNAPATRAEIAATLMSYAKGGKTETLAPGTLSTFSAMNVMCGPNGIALDTDGSLLVTDLYHKQVWRVLNRASESYAGGATVQDLYGQPVGGYNDASLSSSYFKQPWAIAPFLDGWAVSDTENNVVRLVQASGVQTLNGATREKLKVTNLGVAFDHPTGLASDEDGNLYVSDTFNGAVRKITPKGGVSTVAKNLSEPTGLCWKDGVLYVAETGADRVVKVQDGKVSAVASGFDAPQGVAVGDDGSVYVADTGSGAVRMVKNGKVTTVAARDMASTDAGLTSPTGLLVQGGQLYICDTFARKIFVYQIG